jgi:hypothetical protein
MNILHHWCIHTTCFDQHWLSSGVSKIIDETDMLQFLVHALIYAPMCPMLMVVPLIASCVAVMNVEKILKF